MYAGTGYGVHTTSQKGLAFGVQDPDLLRDFGRGSGIKFFRLDAAGEKMVSVIDYLDLDGTGAAINAFHRCLKHQGSRIDAAEAYKRRWKHIPTDPFTE
jgi:hypothetical protein